MKEFFKKHKWHLVILIFLISTAGVSGYYSFRTQNTQNTTQNTDNKIQIEDTKKITNYQLPITNTNTTSTISPSDTTITTPTTTNPVIPHPEPEWQNPITIAINGEEYNLEYRENLNVYEMLQLLSADSKKPFIFSTKEYPGMGYFVDSMNGINNDNQTGKYWIYYINGQSATTGISNYIIQKGDKIEWKYESTNL